MIVVNIEKAKAIAHKYRREARAEEFQPYDAIIAKQIPGADAQAAEEQRQLIREKYADMQTKIDSATTADELKQHLGF